VTYVDEVAFVGTRPVSLEQVFGFPSDEATSGLTNVGGAKKIVADDTFQRRRGIDVRHPL